MDVSTTRMSSKGQIVIPQDMRQDIKEGDKLIIIRNDNRIILRKVSDLDKALKEDLVFAKRTDEALKRYEKGQFKEMEFGDFLKEVNKW